MGRPRAVENSLYTDGTEASGRKRTRPAATHATRHVSPARIIATKLQRRFEAGRAHLSYLVPRINTCSSLHCSELCPTPNRTSCHRHMQERCMSIDAKLAGRPFVGSKDTSITTNAENERRPRPVCLRLLVRTCIQSRRPLVCRHSTAMDNDSNAFARLRPLHVHVGDVLQGLARWRGRHPASGKITACASCAPPDGPGRGTSCRSGGRGANRGRGRPREGGKCLPPHEASQGPRLELPAAPCGTTSCSACAGCLGPSPTPSPASSRCADLLAEPRERVEQGGESRGERR